MRKPFFLYPYSIEHDSPGELEAAIKVFGNGYVSPLVNDIKPDCIVIPRYRVIPFGRELQQEVTLMGATLSNTYAQHLNIANLFAWAPLLAGLTPAAYRIEDYPHLPEGEYFVKGETNSIKSDWFTSAYAPNKKEILSVMSRLAHNGTTAGQEVVIRPFEQFRKICNGVDGRPVFHERRVFTYKGQILSEGFYWSSYADQGEFPIRDKENYYWVIQEALKRIGHLADFIVIDLAEYDDGHWVVIELNDGNMSGLSENDPVQLWENFSQAVS